MTKILFLIIFSCLFIFGANTLVYADRDCNRSVTCSDGTEIITTQCSSVYNIIDGHPEDDKGDDPNDPDHHHPPGGDHPDDPCKGHGHLVEPGTDLGIDPGSQSQGSDNSGFGNSESNDTDDPYHLKHGQHWVYDPDDPYGLRQGHSSSDQESSNNQ